MRDGLGTGGPGLGGGRPRRRWPRPLLVVGLVVGALGLAVSLTGAVIQFMPRTFSAAQRAQIMAWEVGKRWRTWPAGRIFPQTITYSLPGRAFGGGPGLSLTARRVGIAEQASCTEAAQRTAGSVLAQHGCLAVLRATYEDPTQTLAVTVGVAVLPGTSAAQQSARGLRLGDQRSGIRAVAFRRTATARFGDRSQKLVWDRLAGPYLVLTTAGYADGRPWLTGGDDSYTQAELLGLAYGTGRQVALNLDAAPPVPRCPGSPAC